jgi:adenylate cyclase
VPRQKTADEVWRAVLVDGHEPLRRAHRFFRHLPSPPRCKLCHNPFGGAGGRLVRIAGFKPSRKNPNLCARCCDTLPPGGLEVDVAVLFADVRGSTALSERIGAARFAELLNRFYRSATEVLIRHDAIIDKLIGDEVMALFVRGIAGPDYRERAASAGVELVRVVSSDLELPVGAAVTAGTAFVGNVGDQVVDFTALGDPINTAARLQAEAASGEVVIASDLHSQLTSRCPDAEHRTIDVRGKDQPVDVVVVHAAAGDRA